MAEQTYYDILEIPTTASPLEIKKAYRRLALQHHPDRNHGSKESEERFKLIGQAYDCLIDPVKKYDYDSCLKERRQQWQSSRPSTSCTTPQHYHQQSPYYDGSHQNVPNSRVFPTGHPASWFPVSPNFDAHAQFNRNFAHDPFFQEAFRDLDEEFARRFQANLSGTHDTPSQSHEVSNNNLTKKSRVKSKEGWIPWLLRQCGIEVQITSHTSDMLGGVTTTHYSSTADKSYAQKQNKFYRDRQGRQVRVQSIEKDGNQIEDTFVNNQLVQRKVNGIIEPLKHLGSS
jgi:curved DNA-binding protein CbpA